MYRSAVILLWYAVLYVRLSFIFSRLQYTVSLLCQLFLSPQLVHNDTTKSLILSYEHCSPGVTQSLTPSALYSQTSVHERLGSRTIRFTNKFSERKASRMTYCVSSYEHASRQNVDKNKSHWTTF